MDFSILQKALWFIVAISVLVAAHEFGHFIVARKLGFKVLRFSIGFGRPLLSWRGGPPDHIQYWVSMIPLGGYVKMLDEHEGPVVSEDRHRAFHQRPVWQRVAVLLAGPAFNFLFAILAFWLMFVTGVEVLKPVIASVEPESVAGRAGLAPGDEIETIGGQATPTLEDATLQILAQLLDDGRIDLTVRRPDGSTRAMEFDVRGREEELTEPAVLFEGLGFKPGPPPLVDPIIGSVVEGSPADRAGLRAGDRVIRANGSPIEHWDQWGEFTRTRPGATVDVTVLRGEDELTITATLDTMTEGGRTFGRIGANSRSPLTEQRYGVVEALPRAVAKTWEQITFTVSIVVHMVAGDVSLKNMSGPLSIADIAGDAAEAGFAYFLSVLAAVSISLGILNLLPIPLLDGGQIVYQLAEWVKGAPLSERAMVLGQQLGIFFVIALTCFAFYNDIVRLFGS
jgi:regulator of sigma E protease